jgi:hypothetical protein
VQLVATGEVDPVVPDPLSRCGRRERVMLAPAMVADSARLTAAVPSRRSTASLTLQMFTESVSNASR